jgi:Phage P22-like portal protein
MRVTYMAQDPLKPKNDGRIRMPVVDSAMNKIAPRFSAQDGHGGGPVALGYPMGDRAAKEKLLERVRKNMARAIDAESENRKSGLDDRMFKIGQQWPTEIMAQRNLDKRPCLTVNKLPTFIHQIVNDQRQNRPSITINPNGEQADIEVAKMFRGLIRFIERDCNADIAYDTAFDDAVTMGWGYWRVTLEWEAPDSMDCVLVIKQVRNPFSVYLDPAHVDPTGGDAKWAFVTQMITNDEFKKKYPDATQMPYSDGGIGDKVNAWQTKDEVRIAEYYEIEYNARLLVRLSNGHVGWDDDLDDITRGMLKRGKLQKLEERESQVPSVMWYKVTSVDVLKAEEWIGTTIPIVKVIGDATDVEGKLKLSGIVRNAKDPQRMYNYWSPLALDTPLPTPDGWTTMAAVQEGDWLFDEQRKPTRVIGTSPVHLNRACYRVEFDDGSHIIADREHPWQVEERYKRRNLKWGHTTRIVPTILLTPEKHFIEGAAPSESLDSDLMVTTKQHNIVSVTPVPSVPVKCVRIDAPSHLFLAGLGMVPTHNTAETELIALQPKSPWVVEEGQIEGHEDEFKNANVKNIPYLSYKGTSVGGVQAPPPQRQPMSGIPAGIVTAKQGAAQDMMATTGIRFDSTMNERTIDESGRAIRELRRSGDIGAFHYVDNLARSLRRTGEILVEAIPLVYDQKRVVTILRDDDKEEQVGIDPTMPQPTGQEKTNNGKYRQLFNPTFGKYGVTVTIGPSYATKRIEASENMMAFMRALPQTASLVVDLFAKAQDWPGAEEIAARLAKTIPPNLLQPNVKDVPPQVQAILAGQEQSIKQLTEQLRQAMMQLVDKGADRAVAADKIQKDFEAKLLKIIGDAETKMAAVNQRSHDNANTHLAAQAKEFGIATTEGMHLLDEAERAAAQNEATAGVAGAASGVGGPGGASPTSPVPNAPAAVDMPPGLVAPPPAAGGNAGGDVGGDAGSGGGADALGPPPGPAAGPAGGGNAGGPSAPELPPAAMQHLRRGRVTGFANGQRWTMGKNGRPQKVA